MDYFYALNKPSVYDNNPYDTEFLDANDTIRGDAPTCNTCGKYIGCLQWLPPIKVEITFWGEEPGDIVFGTGDDLLVSDRFMSFYRKHKLKGLSGFEKVEIAKANRKKRKGPRILPEYYRVVVSMSRALIDLQASGFVHERPATCPDCNLGGLLKTFDRIIITEGSWSGEDLFYARGLSGTIFTSQRFYDIFHEHEIKNGVLIEASQYGMTY